MPVSSTAEIEVTAFSWVPDFARGVVRDLRVRWALEEAGLDYRVRLFDGMVPRPEDYFLDQPFGQVPAFVEPGIRMFESGAIVLHIGERSETLLPREAGDRARAMSWLFAALNSIEPSIQQLATIDLFCRDEDWAKQRRPEVVRMVRERLGRVADHLGDEAFLEGRFTAGDLMMTTVLRLLRHTDLVAEQPSLAAYLARCESRPAFARALEAQLADFVEKEAA
jgi:glutathione S-transferase